MDKENEQVTLRACSTMKRKITIKSPYLQQEVEISRADGMVGALSVFDDYEKALEYANNVPESLTKILVSKNEYEKHRELQ